MSQNNLYTNKKTYSELQRENEERFADSHEKYLELKRQYDAEPLTKRKLAEVGSRYAQSPTGGDFTEQVFGSGFGSSKYDQKLGAISELDNLNEVRAANQGVGSALANSIVNLGIVAATTAVDSFVGIPFGIINAIGTAAKGGSFSEVRAAYKNNPASTFLQNIQEEFSLPVYQSKLYENASLGQKLGSVNFWGDSIIKNAGFVVGAMVSGSVTGALLSKAAKLDKALDTFKGYAVSAGAGDKSDDALKLLQRYNNGDLTIKAEDLAEAAQRTAKNIKQKQWGVRIGTTWVASDGEARIEAISSAKNYYETMDAVAKQVLQEGTSDQYLMQKISQEHPEYFQVSLQDGEIGALGMQQMQVHPKYAKTVELLKEQYKAEAELKYTQYQEQLKNDFNDYLNRVYTLNMSILLPTNGAVLGKAATGGWSNIKKLVQYGGKAGVTDTGLELAGKSGAKKALSIAKIAGSPISEATQETLQSVVTRASDTYYGDRINNFYEQALYTEGLKSQSTFIGQMFQELGSTLTDPNKWEEGLAGAITSLFGGGIYQEFKEHRESVKETDKYIETYNSFIKDKDRAKYLTAIIRNKYYEDNMQKALENNDKNEYKNNEFDQLINMAMLYYSNGRKESFKKIIDDVFTVNTEQDIEDLKASNLTDEFKSVFDNKSNEEIIEYFKKTKQDILDTIEKTAKVAENLNSIWGNSQNEHFLNELAYKTLKIDNIETRIKGLTEKISKYIEDKKVQLQNNGIDVENLKTQIDNIKDLNVFFEEGQAENLDKELQKLVSKKQGLEEHLALEQKKLEHAKKYNPAFYTLASLKQELESLTKDNPDSTKDVELAMLEQQIKDIYDYLSNNEYTATKSIRTLKGLLTRFNKKYEKLKQDFQDPQTLKDLEQLISNIKKELGYRDSNIKSIETNMKTLQDGISKIGDISENSVQPQDVFDLVRLLAQRQSFIDALNTLQKNPEKFEQSLSEKVRSTYNKYIENKAQKYVDEFKQHKNPYLIPPEYLNTVESILNKDKDANANLLQIIELYKKYIHVVSKIAKNHEDDPDINDTMMELLPALAEKLSVTTSTTLKERNDEVKTIVEDLKNNDFITEELYKEIIKLMDDGIKSSRTNKPKEKIEKKQDVEGLWENEGEDFEDEDSDENVNDSDNSEDQDEQDIKNPESKKKKEQKEKIQVEQNPEEVKTVEKGAIYAEGQKKPIKPKHDKSLDTTDDYNEDELKNISGSAKYKVGEPENHSVDDNTIDALHVGRIHVKYDISAAKKSRTLKTLTPDSVVEFLEEYHSYDFMDNGGMGYVVDYYKSKGKKVPVKVMSVNYLNQKDAPNHNQNMVAVTYVPDGTIKDIKPAFKQTIGNKKYDFYIIGAIQNSSNETIKNQWQQILNDKFAEKSTHFRNINLGDKKSPKWFRLSKFTTTLAWVYSGRVVTHKDDKGNTQERPLKDVLTNKQQGLIDQGKTPFSIVVMKRNDSPIYIGNQKIKESQIVPLNGYRGLTLDASDWAGSVWVLHQEADGKYYHKSVKVRTFDKTFLENESSDNYYIKGITESLESLKEATDEASIKESLRLLRDYLYWPNSNLYVKDGVLYVTHGKTGSINLEQSDVSEILDFLSDFKFRFTFNEEVDLKTLVNSNILVTDLERLGNVGASAIINSIEITENDKNPYEIHESSTVQLWEDTGLIHTGTTGLRDNTRTTLVFKNENYIRKINEDGSIEYFRQEDGKSILVEDEDTIDSIEFLYHKAIGDKNLKRITVGKSVNKYTIYEMVIPTVARDPEVKYFYNDGTKASKIQFKRLQQVLIKKSIISKNKSEDPEADKQKIDSLIERYKEVFESEQEGDYSGSSNKNEGFYDAVIETILDSKDSLKQMNFIDKLDELSKLVSKNNSNPAISTIINHIKNAILNGELEINDVFTTKEDQGLYEQIYNYIQDNDYDISDGLKSLRTLLEEDQDFKEFSKLGDRMYDYLNVVFAETQRLEDLEDLGIDLEQPNSFNEDAIPTYEDTTDNDDIENSENDYPETEEDQVYNDDGFGFSTSDQNNTLNDEFYEVLDEYFDDTDNFENIEGNLSKLGYNNLGTIGGLKKAISDYQNTNNLEMQEFKDFLDNLKNPC